MKSFKLYTLVIVFGALFASNNTYAQCDTIATICTDHLNSEFISDGQEYRALLLNDELAEFHSTFYGGTKYRIAACSGLSDGNLIFSVFDQERNLLFTNNQHSNAPYWDFEVNSTLDVIIEAQLDPEHSSSGCAVLLIGFKQ